VRVTRRPRSPRPSPVAQGLLPFPGPVVPLSTPSPVVVDTAVPNHPVEGIVDKSAPTTGRILTLSSKGTPQDAAPAARQFTAPAILKGTLIRDRRSEPWTP
jgi:hypothetical protein